ncbi:hypothetical protein UFOVP383_73 [uncultured Caudovirales phage]|uniref:Uncharacterized protein n=1 Tax=uncultured Caudovirales phage TaxID=2100421 RepID=A0A6J7X2X6_9CAUD|nr:hypothetical protein UFOVP383_73 [uncultured Caudovirales phage]
MIHQQPLILPPRALIKTWLHEVWHEGTPVQVAASDIHIAERATQWSANRELDACEEWISIALNCTSHEHLIPYLRQIRRPVNN